jgi:hypothetical protein
MTFLFFSVAIHWIRKREKKQSCAKRPRIIQKFISIPSLVDYSLIMLLFIPADDITPSEKEHNIP